MDRIGTPLCVMTMVRPSAGLAEEIERQERDDDRRSYEPESAGSASSDRVFIPRPATGGVSWR